MTSPLGRLEIWWMQTLLLEARCVFDETSKMFPE